jgi:hypothetical protein
MFDRASVTYRDPSPDRQSYWGDHYPAPNRRLHSGHLRARSNRGRRLLATDFATELHESEDDESQQDGRATSLNRTGTDERYALNGPGRPLKVETRVRTPLGLPEKYQFRGDFFRKCLGYENHCLSKRKAGAPCFASRSPRAVLDRSSRPGPLVVTGPR